MNINYETFFIPLVLTTMAGLSTVLGGMLTFFVKKGNLKALSVGLAFSAGVMIFLSLSEILSESREFLLQTFNTKAQLITMLSFLLGCLTAFLIDYFIPEHREDEFLSASENDNEEKIYKQKVVSKKIKRAGLLAALAIFIHNVPEGIATIFVSSQTIKMGIPIAFAIAIHNIPEGIAVALPIYQATGKKRLAIWYSFLSGMAEPLGAVLAFVVLSQFITNDFIGVLFGMVAGIMVYISLDTLLPLAREYGEDHLVLIGIISGMFFVAFGMLLI